MSLPAAFPPSLTEGSWALLGQLAALAEADTCTHVSTAVAEAAGAAADDEDDDAAGSSVGPRARANAVLKRVIGERLAAARALNGWGQMDFAREGMGAANSTQVSLYESGKRLPPLPVLIEVARTLGVSIDYLVGESEEVERDARTAARSAAMKRVERLLRFNAETVTEVLLNACASPASDEMRVSRFATHARALCDAVATFVARNSHRFDDARGGATLLRTMQELRDSLDSD